MSNVEKLQNALLKQQTELNKLQEKRLEKQETTIEALESQISELEEKINVTETEKETLSETLDMVVSEPERLKELKDREHTIKFWQKNEAEAKARITQAFQNLESTKQDVRDFIKTTIEPLKEKLIEAITAYNSLLNEPFISEKFKAKVLWLNNDVACEVRAKGKTVLMEKTAKDYFKGSKNEKLLAEYKAYLSGKLDIPETLCNNNLSNEAWKKLSKYAQWYIHDCNFVFREAFEKIELLEKQLEAKKQKIKDFDPKIEECKKAIAAANFQFEMVQQQKKALGVKT